MAKFYMIGDIAIVKTKDPELVKQLKSKARSIVYIKSIETEKRLPKIEVLWGDENLKTIHKELGIKYVIDLSKVMFSRKNFKEKQRLQKIVHKDDIVVDMFSGIGYFTLPVAPFVKKIYAMDINPTAISLLIEAIKVNKFKNIVPIVSDNRKIRLRNVAHRVLMGYIFDTEAFLDRAIKFARDQAIIHFHRLFNRNMTEKDIKEFIMSQEALKNLKNVEILSINKVKNYSPTKIHYVVDIKIKK